ncbi:cell division protein ZapA [Gehongia tenuis]|uniref:Cell division protein ZapA n=1 Tax=Gehongia tenuis TaxID=2763655 RepID=A0A926HNI3_9FIRM|nr:cell division protein ZapA [Gehongia tenuis]MBC8530644.1 cell division protein ZapA [Gehongia tenuis]
METIKASVKLAGREYTITGAESEEHLQRVVDAVEYKYKELKKMAKLPLDSERLAILTSLNMADDLIRAKDESKELGIRIDELQRQLVRLQRENAFLQRDGRGGGKLKGVK